MTVNPTGHQDRPRAVGPHDWTELGGMVQRAARRAMAVHLVEAAAQMAAGVDPNRVVPAIEGDGQ